MEEEKVSESKKWTQPKNVLMALGILVFGAIVIVSILRESIVRSDQNQVVIAGEGKVSYKADIAKVTLGVKVDKVPTSKEAVSQLNDKMARIIDSLGQLGIGKEEIETQNYSLQAQYDYKDGVQTVAGYDANQKLIITVKDIQSDTEKVGRIISSAAQAGSNQMLGISFETSNLEDLKQQARLAAIADARSKAGSLAKAAGVKLGKVVGWYDDTGQLPENPSPFALGSSTVMDKAVSPAEIPTGTQDIKISVNVTYEVE